MICSIVTPSRETKAPNQFVHAEEAALSEAERASLRLFVARPGVRIADDTPQLSKTKRNRLLFLHWLDMHSKLSY